MDNLEKYFITFEPVWTDHCDHGKKSYIGTKQYNQIIDNKAETAYLDVYVYECQGKQKICLRFGEEGSHYYSPPENWIDFIQAAKNFEPYKQGLSVLEYCGFFSYKRTKTKHDRKTVKKIDESKRFNL